MPLRSPAAVVDGSPARLQSTCAPGDVTRIDGQYPRTLFLLGLGDRLSCGTEDIDAGSQVPWHSHKDAEEVLFCTAGRGTIHVGPLSAPFLPGAMVLVPRATPHRIVNESKTKLLSLTFTLSPPQAPACFRAGGSQIAWLPRVMPLLFMKVSGDEHARATPAVNEMYGDGTPAGEGRAVVAGKLLHMTCHALPQCGRSLHGRQCILLGLGIVWLGLVPLPMKMRCLLGAAAYSGTEWWFTLLERGKGYTSVAQFIANLGYLPILLDGYGVLLKDWPNMYVALFPLNVWLLEIVVGHAIIAIYGHNVAWCYEDYADAYCAACFRLGHTPFWLGLGAICLFVYEPLVEVTNAASSVFAITPA